MGSGWIADRRAVLRVLASVGLLPAAGCGGTEDRPSIAVPSAALTDESVRIEIDGLESVSSVVVRASSSGDTREWVARASFDVDEETLSVPDRAPTGGTYEGADPMGLFWSKHPTGTAPERSPPAEVQFSPDETGYEVALAVEVDGETVAETTTERRLFDPAIERRTVDHDAVVGEFFAPPGDGPVPAVVHLHGVGGRPHLATGRLLASRGIATLTLQYFGDPEPIPDSLVEVPVEYVETAIGWLRGRNRVADPTVGLFGFSRGGTLALLAASRSDSVGAVVGWVPSGVAWEGLGPRRTPAGTAAWSIDGEPVPFLELADADPGSPPTEALPYYEPALSTASDDDLAAASVPVEAADAPIFLVSATDDKRWPSSDLAERVIDRLDAAEYPHEYRHDSHAGAGHYLRFPYLPTAGTTRDADNVYGGSPEANARAEAEAWFETRSFFEAALGDDSSH